MRDAPSLRLLALVAVGGAAGTATRYGLGALLDPVADLPAATVVANLVASFLLGVLAGRLLRRSPGEPTSAVLGLGLGTGFLGGLSTFSTLAVETVALTEHGVGVALGYAVGSVVLGLVACFTGVVLGGRGGRVPRPAAEVAADDHREPPASGRPA